MTMSDSAGVVYLVGGGPGDPGLVTVRAQELITSADAIVYDALVNPALLESRRPDVELVYVGKRGGDHSRTQDEINGLLVELARRHARVVRLKGGDPFIFGRGGEEALVLRAAGIRFEVVPGITAGIAAAAYAGIPVTQRSMASSVTFATGHEDPTKPDTDLDWTHLASGSGTLVFYMGVGRLRENFKRLMAAGRPAETPAAVIEWGTYPRQRVVSGTLSSLPERVEAERIGAPAIVVVGEVVGLRDELAWYESRPLHGRRIVVTRARAQASALANELEALGAEVVQFPTIEIAPAKEPGPLDEAARTAAEYDWIVFTSVNGVAHFWAALRRAGRDARSLAGVQVCAIGPATAAVLERHGVVADLVPERFVAESVVSALSDLGDLTGRRILLPRAREARAVLPDRLRELGAEVTDVVAYETVPDTAGASSLRARIDAGEIDLVTFTASSTVRNFVDAVGATLNGAQVASIGPITSATARELGLTVAIEATEYTVPGLVNAVVERMRLSTSDAPAS